MRIKILRSLLRRPDALSLAIVVTVSAVAGLLLLAPSQAATFAVTAEAEASIDAARGQVGVVTDATASGGSAVRFGGSNGSVVCDNFCSRPVKPIYKTAPVTVDVDVNSGWCGPTWDAPQAEFDLARDKMGAGAIILPPCSVDAGFIDHTPEQSKVWLDKAHLSGLKGIVFPGYVCADKYNLRCYLGMTNPDAAIDRFAYHPALAGIYIADEPPFGDFPQVQAAVERMRIRRPGLVAYVNLFGSFGYNEARPWLGNVTYDKYIQGYLQTVKTTLISVDDYTSPANLEYTLKAIDRWARYYEVNGRPDLANRVLWSAVSTIGGHANHDLAYFQNNLPAFKAVNDKYDFRHLYFTWRVPPEGGRWNHAQTGPGLCGFYNRSKPGTVCGQ